MYGGPVQYRWMYKIERFLCKLKRYVRNKAHPEGSIAEGYIIDECFTFCSMYLTNIETRFNREHRNDDGSSSKNEHVLDIFSKSCRPYGDGIYDAIPKRDFDMARWYVFNNCEEAEPFLSEHKEELSKQVVVNVDDKHREQFPLWFKNKIMQLYNKEKSMSIQKLYPLAIGPDVRGRTHTGCIVNGIRYHVQRCDELRKSQNCGIVVAGYHENELIDFYGIIVDILELESVEENRVLLFKCKWFNLRKKIGMQKDNNFTSIFVKRFWYERDPFVLATQATQMFYINDPKLGENWRIVLRFQDRHLYDVPEKENSEAENDELHITNDKVYQDTSLESNSIVSDSVYILSQLYKDDVDPITLDENVIEMEAQIEHEVEIDYSEDSNQEDDTMIEYISDHEENEGNNNTNDDEVDDLGDDEDIGL